MFMMQSFSFDYDKHLVAKYDFVISMRWLPEIILKLKIDSIWFELNCITVVVIIKIKITVYALSMYNVITLIGFFR